MLRIQPLVYVVWSVLLLCSTADRDSSGFYFDVQESRNVSRWGHVWFWYVYHWSRLWVGGFYKITEIDVDRLVRSLLQETCLPCLKNELSLILSLSLPSKNLLVVGTRPWNISLGNYSALMFPKRPVRLHSSLPLGYMISNNTQVMVPGNLWPRMIRQAPMQQSQRRLSTLQNKYDASAAYILHWASRQMLDWGNDNR